ncbi:unnamed protein product [Pylaiella littoralis]
MNIALAAFGGYPVPTWESQEGAHTPSGSKTPIAICGWLLKMKREHRKFRSTWNRRWFTVEDGAFHWYKTSSSDACGRLSLMDIKSVKRYVGTERGHFTFVVHATDREILLRADSANDESRWIRGLTLQMDLVHGGTFQGPPSAKNRRRTVLKLMGDGCGSGSGSDGRGATSKCKQKGDGSKDGGGWGGGWKGDGTHFREINNRIKAIMNDQDGTRGSRSRSSGGGRRGGEPEEPIRYYSEQPPTQKFKVTPRDPRGISIVGGRGLGKFPAKAAVRTGGGRDCNDDDEEDADSSHKTSRSTSGVLPSSGPRRFSCTTSKVVPIVLPASPCSCSSSNEPPRGGGNDGGGGSSGRNSDSDSDSNSSSNSSSSSSKIKSRHHHTRTRTRTSSRRADGGRSASGNGNVNGRPKPPVPAGPPPANARCRVGQQKFDSNDDDDRYWGPVSGGGGVKARQRGESGARRSPGQHRHSGGGGGRHGDGDGSGSGRRAKPHQARRNKGGGGAGRWERRDRQRFENLADCSSSSSRTRGDYFMDDYVSGETPRGSAPSQHPPKAAASASTTKATANTSSGSTPKQTSNSSREKFERQQQRQRRQRRRQQQQQQHRRHGSDDDDAAEVAAARSSDPSSCPSSSCCSSPGFTSTASPVETSGRNFDNDDCSRYEDEEVSVDRTNYWIQSGYAGSKDAASSSRGGDSSSRGGSATAEDVSWNTGMLVGSSSRSAETPRVGSRRGVGGSAGVGRSSQPSRRYLAEQNQFRQQGW